MKRSQPRNIAASVRQRLLNLSMEKKEDFQNILTRYALERFLYRLGKSEYKTRFILKGAALFSIWGSEPHRITRDLDLLGYGEHSLLSLVQVFQNICNVKVENDGIDFLAETVRGMELRQDQEYEGGRILLTGHLASACIQVQIDIGFGDAVIPSPEEVEFPTLLDFPSPHLHAYSRETVVSEKFQAMVMLGIANSRIKDFYDLWILSQRFSFNGQTLSQSIEATFRRRKTILPQTLPIALTLAFAEDMSKQTQWNAFIRKGRLKIGEQTFCGIINVLQDFLMPPTIAIAMGKAFDMFWPPTGPWQVQ